jgi:C4-dicarboxylate-specific signal transduction histidine kinase
MGEEHRNATPAQMNVFFGNCEESRRIQHYKKGKKPFYVKVKTCPITYKGRKSFILAVTDLTGMMEKEAQLIQANKLTALGEMSSGIAHELNQPLTAIKLGSEFLKIMMEEKRQIDQQDLSEVIHEISNQVDRASQIINRLRAFGRKPDFVKKIKETDVNKSVRNVLAIIAHQMIAENIKVRFDSDEDISPVLALENLLEQVIFSLMNNARDTLMQKKTADSESVLMIEIRSFQEGNRVAIVISDTGTGIPANIRDKIFDPFFTTKEVGKGMGISLSIVYGIVKDLNGDIEVQTEEGKGTAFKLTFPSAGPPGK